MGVGGRLRLRGSQRSITPLYGHWVPGPAPREEQLWMQGRGAKVINLGVLIGMGAISSGADGCTACGCCRRGKRGRLQRCPSSGRPPQPPCQRPAENWQLKTRGGKKSNKAGPEFQPEQHSGRAGVGLAGGHPGVSPSPAAAPPPRREAELRHAPGSSLIESPSSGCKGHHREELLKKGK